MKTVNLGNIKMSHGLIMIGDVALPIERWQGVDNVQGRWVVDVSCPGDHAKAKLIADRYGHAQQVDVLPDGTARVTCPHMRSAGHIASQAENYLRDKRISDVQVSKHALKESAEMGRDSTRETGAGMSQGAAWAKAGSASASAVFTDCGKLKQIIIDVGE